MTTNHMDDAMAHGTAQYDDVIAQLAAAGHQAVFTQTGGMCAALEIALPDGRTVLVTDAEDSLSWDRSAHRGWGVGVYREGSEYDDGPLAFEDTDDGDPAALPPLVTAVLDASTAPEGGRQ